MDTRTTIRRAVSWLFGAVIIVILVSVVGEWFIHVADDKGWYKNAGSTWDRAVSAVIEFVTQPLVIGGIGVLGGLVAGMWLDAWLVRRERERGFGEPAISEIDLNELADGMQDFIRRVSDFKDQRRREFNAKNEGSLLDEMSTNRWFSDLNFHNQTEYQLKREYGPEFAYYCGVLDLLGIKLPPHFRFEGNRAQPETFLGAIARFIERGHLDKAVSLSKDDDRVWKLIHGV